MQQDGKLFSRLLTLDELYDLYLRIGDTINTDIDLLNANYDYLAKDNSVQLITATGLIERAGEYFTKVERLNTKLSFSDGLLKKIRIFYKYIIDEIESKNTNYDESRGVFYGFRNDIPLKYSGILMLLRDLRYLELTDVRYYINNQEAIRNRNQEAPKNKQITLINLENSLLFKKEIGEEAEREVFEFESNLLARRGITKTPIQISHLDASAGYDIASYLDNNSEVPNKFIEVKSYEGKERFYISQNEIETAKLKGDQYYLYLFNRENKTIKMIRNPYDTIIQNEEWAKDPQIFKIMRI